MKANEYSFAPIPALIGLSVAALVAWGISHFSRLGFWPAFAIVVVAMLINGLSAEAEDNAPGGFNNPLPPDTTKPAPRASLIRRLAGFLLLVFGITLAGWVGYNLFIERLPETQGRNPLPAIVMSAGLLFVGYKWMRGQQA